MSGICGIINFDGAPVDPKQLKKMSEAAASRGPDGINYWINGNVGFAHLALNTTPESLQEHQPLLSADSLLSLTADARVDNRDELISTLTTKGYLQSKDPTDADLILAAYKCWGKDCPKFIIGDFAFAIWDAREHLLFCARDAFGIKPLHYAQAGQTMCVASEAQQIIQHPAISRRLDEVAVALHLANNCYDHARTMFQDVFKLPPAHRLVATASGMRLERYWDIDPKASTVYRRDEEYAEHFLSLFRAAVASRLRTQAGTIGIAMSGGLDSTSIVAMGQKLRCGNEQLPQLVAYSYVFDSLKDCDERIYSQAMATELGIEVEFIQGERFWMLDDPETFRPSLETPFMFWESLDRHILRRIKERNARVVLSGHGGDILLEGSPLVYADRLLRGEISALWDLRRNAKEWRVPYRDLFYEFVAKPLVPDILKRIRRRVMRRGTQDQDPPWITADFAQKTQLGKHLARLSVPRRFRSLARQESYEHLMSLGSVSRAVYWFDRTAAYFGLEARHPHFDRRLAEFVMSIPPNQFFGAGLRKLILRRAMNGLLPDIVRLRKDKAVYDSYLYFTLCEKPVAEVNRLFDKPLIAQLGIVDLAKLHTEFEECVVNGWHPDSKKLWNTITLELWMKEYRSTLEM